MAKEKVRLYLLNQRGFLSIGNAYFTDGNDRIMRENHVSVPYTLMPYPIPLVNYHGNNIYAPNIEIMVGMEVFPVCDVDLPSFVNSDELEHPKVKRIMTLPHEKYLEVLKETKRMQKEMWKSEESERKRMEKELNSRKKEIERRFERGLVELIRNTVR